jgi:hypothetical protein
MAHRFQKAFFLLNCCFGSQSTFLMVVNAPVPDALFSNNGLVLQYEGYEKNYGRFSDVFYDLWHSLVATQ